MKWIARMMVNNAFLTKIVCLQALLVLLCLADHVFIAAAEDSLPENAKTPARDNPSAEQAEDSGQHLFILSGQSNMGPIGLIDTHCHFHARNPGDLDQVAEWMQKMNIRRVINHPLRQSRPRNEQERAQMLQNYANYKGRIERFCIIYPEEVSSVEAAVKILTREKKDGAIGFGEHYGVDMMFDDPANMRLYAACEQVGLPVMFHMDRNKNLDEKGLPRLERVLRTFPKLVLIAHSDWWRHMPDGTCGRLLKAYPNLYADISCTVRRSRIGTDKELAREFFIENADKLLFATDSGWWSLGEGTKQQPEFLLIDELKLPREVEDKICRENATRLFGFDDR